MIKVFREESLKDSDGEDPFFHKVIFTAPYEPNSQPCENLWGYDKNFVSRSFVKSRGLGQLRLQTRMGFYGDGKRHQPVNAAFCARLVARSTRYVNEWLADDDVLGDLGEVGSLNDTEVKNFLADRDTQAAAVREAKEAFTPMADGLLIDESLFGAGDREDDDVEAEEAKAELFCVCKKVYDAKGEAMVECTTCKGWFHLSCVDLTASSPCVTKKKVRFTCDACTYQPSPDRKRSKRWTKNPKKAV